MSECTESKFIESVSKHRIHILNDNGVYRHIRFDAGDHAPHHFAITTWPGYLAISGDMGDYTFKRLEDMFPFFRQDGYDFAENPKGIDTENIFINVGYWTEKLTATSLYESHSEFNDDELKEQIKEYFDTEMESIESLGEWSHDYSDDHDMDDDDELDDAEKLQAKKDQLWDRIESDMLYSIENEYQASVAIDSFSSENIDFQDFLCEGRFGIRPTYHYIWCMYAIAWGISLYDLIKARVA